MSKKNKKNGSVGINIEAPTNFDADVLDGIASGFSKLMKAGFKNHLEQDTIREAIKEFANIVHKTNPNFTISNCSIINGEVQ